MVEIDRHLVILGRSGRPGDPGAAVAGLIVARHAVFGVTAAGRGAAEKRAVHAAHHRWVLLREPMEGAIGKQEAAISVGPGPLACLHQEILQGPRRLRHLPAFPV